MVKEHRTHRSFELDFKLLVLKDYYESGASRSFIAHKYGIDRSSIVSWEKRYSLSGKDLNLSAELCKKIESMRKAKEKKDLSDRPLSHEEELELEVKRLRRALEYSELRNEALNEVLKIGRDKYGIDLLKKAGAKQ